MKKTRIPLFTKFAIGISLTVLIFGLLNALIVRNSVDHALNTEFEKRGYFIARAVAEQAVFYILSEDPAGLNSLINEIKAIDPSIHYVFVVSETGDMLAHSFPEQVPKGLVLANVPDNDFSIVSVRDVNDPAMLIRDFSVPIMSRSVAYVRLGILENDIVDHVKETITTLWLMVAIFLLLGLLAALFFSYTIATPLRVLSHQSQNIDIRNIQDGVRIIKGATLRLSFKIRRVFNSADEIDLLYANFAEMLQRLEQTHNTMNNLQQSLMQAEKMASIGTLTAGVAHEINNPLAGLRIGLKRIARKPEDAKQTIAYIEMMQEALNKMEHVVQDLLTFSRQSPHKFEEVNACEILQKSIKMARYRIRRNKIVIEIAPENCPHKILIASNRMEQVFLNIIINSVDAVIEKQKHMPGLEGKIQISIRESDGFSMISFRDNGIGMEKVNVSKIFDPFFTTKKMGEGTGLGLSVSYQIIKDHGGEILVESEPNEGTVFTVVLPNQKTGEEFSAKAD